MSALKIIIFNFMLLFEIFSWHLIGNTAAPLFIDKNEQQEYSSSCDCNDVVIDKIKNANLPSEQKVEYIRKYSNIGSYERELFNKEINNIAIPVSYEDRKVTVSHYIMFGGLIISFAFLLLVIIILNQGDCTGYIVPLFSWVIIGIIYLIYNITIGRKERAAEKRANHHKKLTGVADKFRNFTRMA